MALIEVKPLPKEKPWHGVTDPEKSFTRPKVYEVVYNPQTGKYMTGLTAEEQKWFESQLGIDLSDRFIQDQPHPFFSTRQGQIILENNTMFFDENIPMRALKIKLMKASDFVANSLKEWEEGKYPYATHYICDTLEEDKKKASKIEARNQCIALLMSMSVDEKLNLARVLTNEPLKNRSANTITIVLDKIIEEKPEEFVRYAKMDKDEMYIRSTILEALDKNILVKEGLTITYMGEVVGEDLEDTIKKFQNPQHQQLKIKVLEKLESTKA